MGSPEDKEALDSAAFDPKSPEEVPLVEIVTGAQKEASPASAEHSSTLEKPEKPKQIEFTGMDKYELQKFANDPFWKKVRLIIFILFWVVWIAMLVAVILIIVLSKRCPPRPNRKFWQNPAYKVQVRSFYGVGSNGAKVFGNLAGLKKKLPYLRETLIVNNFILDGLYSRNTTSKCPTDFGTIDKSVGTISQVEALCKSGRKKGFFFMMDFDASQTDPQHNWFTDTKLKNSYYLFDSSTNSATGVERIRARDGQPAWNNGFYRAPSSQCMSLNVSNSDVRNQLFKSMKVWLNAGVSGFVLRNVAFLAPQTGVYNPPKSKFAGATSGNWFEYDPTGYLFSDASVEFVKAAKKFLNDEASSRDKDLVLMVDFGNVGFELPLEKIKRYYGGDGADVLINTNLGIVLSSVKVPMLDRSGVVSQLVTKKSERKDFSSKSESLSMVTNWDYLGRQSTTTSIALGLTLPGVPILYYGQEIGMEHVPGVTLSSELTDSLSGADKTDASKTPMQWSECSYNFGWSKLCNSNNSLTWVNNIDSRKTDAIKNNVLKYTAAGHPYSILNLTIDLLDLFKKSESLQWGYLQQETGHNKPNVLVFNRIAEEFPVITVLMNFSPNISTTINSNLINLKSKAKLKMFYSPKGGQNSYKLDNTYDASSIYLPPNSFLIFETA